MAKIFPHPLVQIVLITGIIAVFAMASDFKGHLGMGVGPAGIQLTIDSGKD